MPSVTVQVLNFHLVPRRACRPLYPLYVPPPFPLPPFPQALGLVGSLRKRMLLLWQAVELSKYLGFPNLRSLEVAR